MSWWNRRPASEQSGSALFRGRWVARPEDFGHLEKAGVRVGPAEKLPGDGGWKTLLEHAAWGRATLLAMPDPPVPPPELVDWDPRLLEEEKEAFKSCRYAVGVACEGRTGNVLADRKDLLRFLHATLGSEGVAAVDHTAQALWSRRGLEDELAHEAELDIDGLYTLHLLYDPAGEKDDPESRRSFWMHSHGLAEIGFTDFDVLDPFSNLDGRAHEVVRALAFAVVEGRLAPGGAPFPVVGGHPTRLVPARDFLASAPASAFPDYRGCVDDSHLDGHAVVCDPASQGLLSRLLGRAGRPRPYGLFTREMPEEGLVMFSNSATALMAERARKMLPVLREMARELSEFEPGVLVKLGYPVDGGGPTDREHLWFEVHGFAGDTVDATLTNQPFYIARLQQGARGTHPLELLSDWAIFTPFGRIDPRSTRTARFIRGHRAELSGLLAKAKAEATQRGEA